MRLKTDCYLRFLVGGEVPGDGDPSLRVQLQRGDHFGVVALGKVADELDAVPLGREERAEGQVQGHPLPRYLRVLEGGISGLSFLSPLKMTLYN